MRIASVYAVSIIIFLSKEASSICLFPPEFEGEFIIQNAVVNDGGIQYSTVNITADTLFPYGQCYSRNASNVIVVLSFEDNECYRCFSLQMVSQNIILLIHNEENINSKCSSSAETVKCPEEIKLNDENQSDFHSIVLYRMSGREGALRRYEFCPFNFFDSEVKFDYFINDEKVCTQNSLSQCPSGMNLRFKGCSNGTFLQNTYFECIGHWKALNRNYLAVIEWVDAKATYKCGTYETESDGSTILKINGDCSSLSLSNKRRKFSPTDNKNQQIFKIHTKKGDVHATQVSYPSWLQGQWTNMEVNGTKLIYRDPTSFKFYRMTIVEQLNAEKFIVSSHSQCGEDSYKCLVIRKLDENILEFQMIDTTKESGVRTCNEENTGNSWLTQARAGNDVIKTSCPISGKYLGHIPDSPELCAVMTSNCNSPDIMNFEIGLCGTSEIYEKRAYRCMGQWTDKEVSAVYTFTKRDDIVNTYECFVGLMTGSDEQIVIREAGENCYKLDPLKYGMEMNQTEKCQTTSTTNTIEPSHEEQTIQYEVSYDDKSTMIDFSVATSTTSKTKTHKKQKIAENDQLNETTSGTAATRRTAAIFLFCGFALMISHLLKC